MDLLQRSGLQLALVRRHYGSSRSLAENVGNSQAVSGVPSSGGRKNNDGTIPAKKLPKG